MPSFSKTLSKICCVNVLQVPIGFDKDGKQIMTDCFYCEWLGSYGALAIQFDFIVRHAAIFHKFNSLVNVSLYLCFFIWVDLMVAGKAAPNKFYYGKLSTTKPTE